MTPPRLTRCPTGCGVVLEPMVKYAPYRTCSECGTGYYVPAELQGDYYSAGVEPADWQHEAWAAREHQWRWVLDVCQTPSHGRVLDVGSGWGHFVNWATTEGYDTIGVETDAWARAGSLCSDRISASLPDSGRFDLITMFDVLEHIVEPLKFAQTLVGLLNPGGRLFVGGPCFDAIRIRWEVYRRHEGLFSSRVRPAEHVSQFTAIGQQRLLERAGFVEVARVYPPLNRHHNRITASVVKALPMLRDSMFFVGIAPGAGAPAYSETENSRDSKPSRR